MGSMGKGLLHQSLANGPECVTISDIDIQKCVNIAQDFNILFEVTHDWQQTKKCIEAGMLAIQSNCTNVAECEYIDVFVEASSSVVDGGFYAKTALERKKHLVLMNSEVDLIFGPHLVRLADRQKCTYTSCDGDQHGVIKRLLDEITLWGFRPIMAGNIKGFLDRYANPTTIVPEADKRDLSYKMCTAYTDGTKLNIEMALVANATGMLPTQIGMTGARFNHVNEILDKLPLHEKLNCVDYILGAEPGGGVFVIGYNSDSYKRYMMNYFKMGNGPYYVFYRPYHLCHIEAMQCILDAAGGCNDIYKSLLRPESMKTNVFAFAKKDLAKGERLDGIGGYTCYGMIDTNKGDENENRLPICLAENVVLKRDIPKNSSIMIHDIEMPASWEREKHLTCNSYDPWRMYMMALKGL